MIIEKMTLQTSNGIYKIIGDEGPAFYIRQEYLPSIKIENIYEGAEFNESETEELLDAGLAVAVEFKATGYLARAEQCRFNLTQKLIKKGFQKQYVNMSLDYLESVKYLSDERFARAWLHGRRLNHYEGRSKLLSELQSRGIAKNISEAAVIEFFENNDESEIALKAYKKYIKQGKTDEKLVASMMAAGFTYKQIKNAKESFVENN